VFIRFGDFEFNGDTSSLLKRGQLVHLTPRAVKLLGILLANRPHAVAKGELERQIWPDTFVADTSLPNVILELRKSLDDSDQFRFIKTVHGVGYVFSGEAHVEEAPPSPAGSFRLLVQGRVVGLVDGENWIGRATECRIQVDCDLVSRRHACIVVQDRHAILKDGVSRNGTLLNHKRLTQPAKLRHRDEIRVGTIHLAFRIVHPDRPTDAEKAEPTSQTLDRPARTLPANRLRLPGNA
jgi:DNA-binding winged helix-turn-helix (wHTH) protein